MMGAMSKKPMKVQSKKMETKIDKKDDKEE